MAGVSRTTNTSQFVQGAGGAYPQDYNSANTSYIPEIWAGKLIENYYKASTVAAITSTDYEGLIKSFGDNIIIRNAPLVSISDYTVGQALTYDVPAGSSVELTIDRAKSWALACDDVDKMQADINLMQEFSAAAAESMKVEVDSTVLDGIAYTAKATTNIGTGAGAISADIDLGVTTAPITLTTGNIVGHIIKMGQVLDEQNVPESGRYVVISAAIASLLKQSELKDASLSGDSSSMLRNGKIGMIDRFTVYSSNNLPSGLRTDLGTAGTGVLAAGETIIYAGVPSAVSFASQIVKNETLPNPDSFGELMRGLQVFGFLTSKPEALVQSVVTI